MITNFTNEQEMLELQDQAKQQITALGSALFFTQSRSVLSLPVHVINKVVVDDENDIWFLIQRPTQELSAYEIVMPARLDFFKKGMPYNLKVEGTAYIVDDAAKISELAEGGSVSGVLAMRVSIISTEYFETAPRPKKGWRQLSKQYLNSMFW